MAGRMKVGGREVRKLKVDGLGNRPYDSPLHGVRLKYLARGVLNILQVRNGVGKVNENHRKGGKRWVGPGLSPGNTFKVLKPFFKL